MNKSLSVLVEDAIVSRLAVYAVRIAIMGAPGTGKTTLATALSRRCSLQMAPEGLRDIVRKARELEASRSNEERCRRHSEYIDAAKNWLSNRDAFLSRNPSCVLDCCCFDLLIRCILFLSSYGENEHLLKQLVRACQRQASQLDLVVVLPVNNKFFVPPYNEDGLKRPIGISQKIYQQSLILGLLCQFCNVPVLMMPRSAITVEARILMIKKALQSPLGSAEPHLWEHLTHSAKSK